MALKKIKDFREPLILFKLEHKNIIKLEGVLRDISIPSSSEIGFFNLCFKTVIFNYFF